MSRLEAQIRFAPMAVVAGYLIATGAAIAIVWMAAGRRHTVTRDAAVNLGESGGRHVGILAGLSGFAVNGMVLIVTLGRNLPDSGQRRAGRSAARTPMHQ